MLTDEPPYLSVGTEVSAKYKGAFCEAKVRKVDKTVKCKVSFKLGCGTYTVLDSSIKGTLRVGALVEAKHPEKKDYFEATITKIQDCSQYTVVFDDGDITTLRRSALCLKSGRHFAESETLDQLPLTHPEHFGNPVVGGGGRRGRRRLLDDSSGDEENIRKGKAKEEKEANVGKVVCVELGDKKKIRDNWFPGLVVSPNAQDTVQIRVKDEYLIRSFSDGRYYTVPKKEASEFTREIGVKVDNNTLKTAVEKALHFIDKDELPPHWDRELLFGLVESDINSDSDDGLDSDSSDDEPREEKDHFVAQLYKFMDDRGTPINNCPSIGGKDLDLYKLFNVVHKLNGYNRVTNRNQWKNVSTKLGLGVTASIITQVKHAYKKYLHSFEDFYRKLGCTMVSHPRNNRARNKSGRSLIRDKDRTASLNPAKVKCDLSAADVLKSSSFKAEETSEKDVPVESKNAIDLGTEKKDEKIKSREDDIESIKSVKGKHSKRGLQENDDVSESEESISFSEDAFSINRPTSSLRKKFPTLKASPIMIREKRKAEGSSDGRKCKRTRALKSRSSSGSDMKALSDGEDDAKRNSTRSRSKEDVKCRKDSEKDKKIKGGSNAAENQKKIIPVKAPKRHDTEEAHLQRKGRKRRNTDTGGKSPCTGDEDLNLPCLPAYKSVFIGDILKIYYGAPGEPKVIYEAKVVDIKENETGETIYLVHYAGWNSRYDEWVKRNKIADNLNWTPARGKVNAVGKQQGPKSMSQKRKQNSGKGEQSTGPGTRASTPLSSSASSRSKAAPLVPFGGKRVTRNTGDVKPTKRTRRASGQTDISVDSESDSEAGEPLSEGEGSKKVFSGCAAEEVSTTKTLSSKKITKSGKKKAAKREEKTSEHTEEESVIKARRNKKAIVPKEKEAEDKKKISENLEDEKTAEEPRGRDFDLNEIRSELKGIDKALKVNTDLLVTDCAEDAEKEESVESGDSKNQNSVEERKESQPLILPQPIISNVESSKSEEKELEKFDVQPGEKKEEKDDIYEFKEPEPFEYQEILRPMNRVYEEGDRSPDKSIKKAIALPEKKDVCKFEVDVKSRFRKTIGKKMKEVNCVETKKDFVFKTEKPDGTAKVEAFIPGDSAATKPPEKEKFIIKMEGEAQKPTSLLSEPVPHICNVISKDDASGEKREALGMPNLQDTSSSCKPELEMEICKIPNAGKAAAEPLNPTPGSVVSAAAIVSTASGIYGNGRSPLLNLINDERKPLESKKNEIGQEDEEDPISAAIQRVIAQSSMDDDSDDMELFAVPSSEAAIETTQNAPKNNQMTTQDSKSELLISKKVNSKRKSMGKRMVLSKEFVMDDSSSDTDSDSAEERLIIVNEDDNTTDDSNRSSQKAVMTVKEEEKRTAGPPSVEGRPKKTEEGKAVIPDDVSECKPPVVDECPLSEKVTSSAKVDEEWKLHKQEKPAADEEGENNIRSLLCEETIPGSPAPLLEIKEPSDSKLNVLELHFASSSQPMILPPPTPPREKREGNNAAAVMDNTPPTTPESNLSSMSGSPRDDRVGSSSLDNESSKSLRDSSEVDVDNDPDQHGKIMKYPKKTDKDSESSPVKKKWRNRKRSESLSEGNKRVRQTVGRPSKTTKELGSDSDDTSENSQSETHAVNAESLINSRSQKPSKYNFYCELDPELDATQRIALLEQKLLECRKTYMNVKSKLASIDRRRKKLRRREREAIKVSKMLERMTDQ